MRKISIMILGALLASVAAFGQAEPQPKHHIQFQGHGHRIELFCPDQRIIAMLEPKIRQGFIYAAEVYSQSGAIRIAKYTPPARPDTRFPGLVTNHYDATLMLIQPGAGCVFVLN